MRASSAFIIDEDWDPSGAAASADLSAAADNSEAATCSSVICHGPGPGPSATDA